MRLQFLFHLLPAAGLIPLIASVAWAQVDGDSGIHDPSRILKEGDRYYVYHTAWGVGFKYSDDLTTWEGSFFNRVFNDLPSWVADEVPDKEDENLWAPSILQYGDEYRMYYSVSTFGSQESAIGLATNSTLDFTSPEYQWVDQGPVLDSEWGYPYNAIDPSVFVDADERMWMTWGSFWDGIFITELDPADGMPLSPNPRFTATHLAEHPFSSAIEAPYIHYRDGYYYLFVNWGSCCQGVDSTYEIRVGRSTNPTGPFFDNSDTPVDMADGGGTLFLDTEGFKIGPGHMSVFSEDGVDYYGYHFYDATDGGDSHYEIERLIWDEDGWPIAAGNLLAADLNNDGQINRRDWLVFAENHLDDISGLPPAQQAAQGDLDGDGDNDFQDFRLFEEYFNAFNGTDALDAVRQVPEPWSVVLLISALSCSPRRGKRWVKMSV